ncbi:MAG: hypothetical protein M1480_00940 [Bacteroidetes bacterium]|nr:hypothetical protein [Bacteroidota bacterium]
MQKLDFTKAVDVVRDKLKTDSLLKIFNESLKTNVANYDGRNLTSLIMESKSNFDRIIEESDANKIIETLGGTPLYESKYISDLLNNFLSKRDTYGIYYNKIVYDFYCFHQALDKIYFASQKLFFEEKENNYNDNYEDGIIIFELFSDSNLNINLYSKIFNLLDELMTAISKGHNPQTPCEPAIITLLDSGSNTNIGIKTTAEVAKSLFLAFKEIWDWLINKKHYKSRIENQSLLENLDVLEKIKEYEQKSVINSDEAKTLVHTIKTRINDLLDLNLVPKVVAEQEIEISKTDLLLEYKELKQLKAKNND